MKTLGKVLGALGLLALLTAPLTAVLTAGQPWYAGSKALLGLLFLAVWLATHLDRLASLRERGATLRATFGRSQGTRAGVFYLSSAFLALALVAGLVAVNFIAARRNRTWDLTQKKIHSLSPQTLSTLKGLQEPFRAVAFMPPTHTLYSRLESLFSRYRAETERFSYSFLDPAKHPDLAAKYKLREGQVSVVVIRGSGPDEAHTSLGFASEEDLTHALNRLSRVTELNLYFVQGHGEWPLTDDGATSDEPSASLAELRAALVQDGYTPKALNLAEVGQVIPANAAALIIAGARNAFTAAEKTALERYLAGGGRLVYFADARGEPGLDSVLERYGIQVDTGLVADDKLSPDSPFTFVTPYFAEHEITSLHRQLKLNVQFHLTRSLSILRTGDAALTVTPLVLSSPYAWVETQVDLPPSLTPGEKSGSLPLVAAATRGPGEAGGRESRVVVFGDGELVVDAFFGREPDRNLVLNGIAWASSQVERVTIRPPSRDLSTLELSPERMARLRFLSMDLLPLTLMGLGLSIWLARRNR